MSFGKNLKQIRAKKGFTQTQLAEKVGVSQAAIVQFEREIRQPTIGTAQQIAEALECELTELVS